MDMSHFEPARPSGLGRDELTEAVNRMSRERQPSTSRLAATFSTPQEYRHDELFLNAQKQARPASQVPAGSPFQFEDGARVQRMADAASQHSPQRPEASVQAGHQQPAQTRVPQARQRTRTPVPQPQPQARPQPAPQPRPVPQAQPQPQPVPQRTQTPAPRRQAPARQAPLVPQPQPQPVRPQPQPVRPLVPQRVQTAPVSGQLGGQFPPLRPPSQAPVASPSPARDGGGFGVEIPVTPDARPVSRESRKSMEVRPAPENVSILRPGTVSTTPAPGSALGGQFGRYQGLADRYQAAQAAGDRLGQRRVAHDVADEMGRPAPGVGDLGEEIA